MPTAEQVWGAAVKAQNTNKGYSKVHDYDDKDNIIGFPNKVLVATYLSDPTQITDEEIEEGKQVREHFKGLTLKALKKKLTDFEKHVLEIVEQEDWSGNQKYHQAIVASLPNIRQRELLREEFEDKVKTSTPLAIPEGSKVELTGVTVLRSFYSNKWDCYFINVETKDNNIVYFSYRDAIPTDTRISIKGTVKRHTDTETQLNRVKVL